MYRVVLRIYWTLLRRKVLKTLEWYTYAPHWTILCILLRKCRAVLQMRRAVLQIYWALSTKLQYHYNGEYLLLSQ